jgi:hypothetical protein
MDVDGQPATVLLRWVARATGRQLEFANEHAQQLAERTVLHGTIGDLSPALAVRAVLATTSLSAEIGASTIRVMALPEPAPAGQHAP